MSNLSLPHMSHGNLLAILQGRDSKKIAYETTATITPNGQIAIAHHGNQIAVISPSDVWLTNAGWNSQTTVQRLHSILKNALPGTEYGIAIRQGKTVVLRSGKIIQDLPQKGVFINRNEVLTNA